MYMRFCWTSDWMRIVKFGLLSTDLGVSQPPVRPATRSPSGRGTESRHPDRRCSRRGYEASPLSASG